MKARAGGRPTKRRLIVVSNRGPLRSITTSGKRKWIRAAGGLVTAVDPMMRVRRGVWVCAQEGSDDPGGVAIDSPDLGYDIVSVRLSKSDQRGFYDGVSNAIVWPLLHSFPPTARVGEAPWPSYVTANREFADSIVASSAPHDIVWVHDYHLMLVPELLRGKRRSSRIGWFCHVPWPNPDIFGILPWRSQILEGILGADVIGFHTELYGKNFLECVDRFTDRRVDWARRTVRSGEHTAKVVNAPIGVPFDELDRVSSSDSVREGAAKLRESLLGRRIVLGVDRLDYTKGIPERILAYERFLARDRRHADRYVLVQVMVPSRTDVEAYARLKAEIDRLIGSVNGRFARTGRVPLHYLYQNLDRTTLFAHYLAAEIALVTPLRDGMNLVAHEYVVAHREGNGALVLSEFAGAAEYMKDAFLVNPYDIEGMSRAIEHAFETDTRERRARMRSMRKEVERLDVHRWADSFLEQLEHHVHE